MGRKKSLIAGVGINDADYVTRKFETINGKQKLVWVCPFYRRWYDMLTRCYSAKHLEKFPTYKGCTVIEEWKTFSNFRNWMIEQDYEGKQLDKDILIEGNKVYSPETCVFVSKLVNSFFVDSGAIRGDYPIGVSFNKPNGKFRSNCSNPFTKKGEHLGCFDCPNEAHLVWKARKHELACMLADSEHVNDPRVAEALKTRFI